MYRPYSDEKHISIKIDFDPNTAKGFAISLSIYFLLIFIISTFRFEQPVDPYTQKNLIPMEMISFGMGDGTGISKGNLSAEGQAHKGRSPVNQIEDASFAAKQARSLPSNIDDPLLAKRIEAKPEITSTEGSKNAQGTGARDIGSSDGLPEGIGLGDKGFGPGAGFGLGDIEWGGGGNRIVLYKVLPKYPPNYNVSAQIRIKFVVSPQGYVIQMIPLQKGDPVLERAAMDALRQWRFNPLKENKEMWGIITFTFRVS